MATMASAQKIDIGLQVIPSIPVDDAFSELFDFGFGGKLTGEYFLNDNIGVGVDIGYITFSETAEFSNPFTGNVITQDIDVNIVPIQATGTYHLDASEDFDVFGGAGVGVAIVGDGESETDSETNLAFSPRIGASYAFSDKLRGNFTGSFLVVTAEEDDADSAQFLNFNLGVTYTLWD